MKRFEDWFERLFFASRWLLAPFFFGLVLAVVALLAKFVMSLYTLMSNMFVASSAEMVVRTLTLVDTALLASLLVIVAFSGYENFVSKLGIEDHEDRPSWMGKVGFAGLKMKLISAIVAISAVELLKDFININDFDERTMAWKVGIHMSFVISGVLFALTDYIANRTNKH